tara:strand:- start:42246 stop:42524 length:279 start_codon:yes stop_codon:yes gene_type:complete
VGSTRPITDGDLRNPPVSSHIIGAVVLVDHKPQTKATPLVLVCSTWQATSLSGYKIGTRLVIAVAKKLAVLAVKEHLPKVHVKAKQTAPQDV